MDDKNRVITGRTTAALNYLPLLIVGNGRSAALTGLGAIVLLLPIFLVGTYYSLAYSMVNQAPGETGLSALEWLRTGMIGNPYIIPTGPTAHAAPGTMALLAAVYALFDGNTAGARVLLRACKEITALV